MNYEKIYKQIIEFRKENPLDKDQYGENHHIIPKCLGGSDDKNNLVRLSAREHFICHMLLAEMYPKETFEWYKMNHAFMLMKANSSNQMRYINNRYYELKRKDFGKTMSFNQSGLKSSQFGKIWIHSMAELKSIKVHKSLVSDYLENGYEIGRVINFDKKLNPEKYKQKSSYLPKTPISFEFNGLTISGKRQDGIKETFNLSGYDGVKILYESLFDLYINKQLSTTKIGDIYNTYSQKIMKYLKFFKIPTRNHAESYIVGMSEIKKLRKQIKSKK